MANELHCFLTYCSFSAYTENLFNWQYGSTNLTNICHVATVFLPWPFCTHTVAKAFGLSNHSSTHSFVFDHSPQCHLRPSAYRHCWRLANDVFLNGADGIIGYCSDVIGLFLAYKNMSPFHGLVLLALWLAKSNTNCYTLPGAIRVSLMVQIVNKTIPYIFIIYLSLQYGYCLDL